MLSKARKNHSTEGSKQDPFASLLREQFLLRRKKRENYSLRSFAQYLQIDQSLLSKVLNGSRKSSRDLQEKVLTRLGLLPPTASDLSHYKFIDSKIHEFLREWSHFAILELIKTSDFRCDVNWIASRLKLHPEEVRAACTRLEELGFIARKGKNWSLLRPDNSWTDTKATTESRRLLQKRYLEMSLEALDHVNFTERDHGSLTVAIDRKRLPEFKEKLKKLRQEFGDFAQSTQGANEVYQLTVSFFPLTHLKERSS